MAAKYASEGEIRLYLVMLLIYTALFAIAVAFINLVGGLTGNSDYVDSLMNFTSLAGWYFALLLALLPVFLMRRTITAGLSNFFFPDEEYTEAQPLYSPIEAMEVQHDYAGAISGWLEIIESHPHLPKAYMRLMDLYALRLDDYDNVEKVFRLGMTNLRQKNHRLDLEAAYQLIQQRKGRIQSP